MGMLGAGTTAPLSEAQGSSDARSLSSQPKGAAARTSAAALRETRGPHGASLPLHSLSRFAFWLESLDTAQVGRMQSFVYVPDVKFLRITAFLFAVVHYQIP